MHALPRRRRLRSAWIVLWLVGASLTTTAASQPSSVVADAAAESAALRRRALELGYNLDRAEALATLDRAIAVDPDNPTNPRLAAAAIWSQLLFDQGAVTVEDYLGQARASVERSDSSIACRCQRAHDCTSASRAS